MWNSAYGWVGVVMIMLLCAKVIVKKSQYLDRWGKLMQLDRPWAKFCLKSDSNLHLIDFFDPNSWNVIKSPRQIRLYLVWFISKKSIYIKNRLNLVKNGQKRLDFWLFWHFPLELTIFNWMIHIDTIIFDLLIKKW